MSHIKKITFLLLLLMTSCLNDYEKEVVGEYKVYEYETLDGQALSENELPFLTLKSDKTFIIKCKSDDLEGSWEINDYGDFTLFEMFIKRENYVQSRTFIGNIISFENFQKKIFKSRFSKISFIKTSSNNNYRYPVQIKNGQNKVYYST
jgi:hypothetical protein